MIEAKIVADSVGPNGVRLTTFVLTYPRFIHSEFMTHRAVSRNASSSRAIPVLKQLKMVLNNPAMPIAFAANKAGMQAGESFGPLKQALCRAVWKTASFSAVFFGYLMEKLNIHKQYANRLTEPFAHITVVATATDWANFFALRCHEMAQPEIHALADLMYEAYSTNKPQQFQRGQWHLPFITASDVYGESPWNNSQPNNYKVYGDSKNTPNYKELIKRSVARCARVSYLNHDGKKPTVEQDLQLYDRLVGAAPIHASPAEHQAQALPDEEEVLDFDTGHYKVPTNNKVSGNFRGWLQYRKTLPLENVTTFTKG